MKNCFLVALATGLLLLGKGGVANADLYNFHLIGDDTVAASDLGSQLQVDVTDGSSVVNFKFMNIGSIASVIAEVYFDVKPNDFLLFSSFALTYAGEVKFVENATPPVLPGGNTISFVSDWDAGADNPAPKWGVSNSIAESLTISFNYKTGQSYSDIINSINTGNLLMGLHVTGIAPTGGSEAYVNNGSTPVPEPATMLLFGTGLVGLAGLSRRRKP